MSFDSFDEVVVDGVILEATNFKASKDVQNSKTNVGLANVVYIGWNFTAAVKEMPLAETRRPRGNAPRGHIDCLKTSTERGLRAE